MTPAPTDDGSMPSGAARCVCRPIPGLGVPELHLEQAVIPAAVRSVRIAVRAWARDAGLDPDVLDSVVLAVDEAVANVIDHAYLPRGTRTADDGTEAAENDGDRIEVRASGKPCGAGVAVSIVDHGTWRPPPRDPGHRGRGVRVIGYVAHRSTITPTAHGTTVHMCWDLPETPVPRPE